VVFREVGIEEENGDIAADGGFLDEEPGFNFDGSILDLYFDDFPERGEKIFRLPLVWVFDLFTVGREFLVEVAFFAKESNCDEGYSEVGSGADGIAGQDA
jgi:hypothetical protein